MFKTILCAIDGSAATEKHLLYVMHFGKTERTGVHFIHAYQLPHHYAAMEGYEALITEYKRVANGVVEDAKRYLAETGIDVNGEAVEGPPAEVILTEARRLQADLIILGSRAPSDASELFLGSVSQQVLNAAYVPVLVIP
ncbi:MAG: universal stress protein [Chloroflexi bacterium]|nr:universal stress protein [Chloroflexota bacterium]